MGGLMKVFVLFICCFSELHVHAKSKQKHKSQVGLELPSGCLKSESFPCALHSQGRHWKVELGGVKVVLSKNTIVVWNHSDSFQIVTGQAWFSQESLGLTPLNLNTEYGRVQVRQDLNLFVNKTPDLFEIYPISGVVEVYPLGRKQKQGLLLPAGYRSFLGAVTEKGEAYYEIPVAANLKGFITAWAPLFDGTPQDLTLALSNYREYWVSAVKEGADFHSRLAKREIASNKRRLARLAEIKRRRLEEERYLKRLFRKKNHLDH